MCSKGSGDGYEQREGERAMSGSGEPKGGGLAAGGRLAAAKDELLTQAAETCVQTPGIHQITAQDALAYLRLYYRHVAPEDLLDRDPVDIGGPAPAPPRPGGGGAQGRGRGRG